MRLLFTFVLLAFTLQVSPAEAADSTSTVVKNCVMASNGKARLVPARTTKCAKGEKLVSLVLPVTAPESLVHSGPTAPIDFNTGHDGDFYIDSTAKKIYGPRIAGVWGAGSAMVGEVGAAGKNGATLISGTTAPDLLIGLAGDFYLDIDARRMYGPKSERFGWGSGFSITGAQGVSGTPGTPGTPGATGATGATGAKGGFGAYGYFYDTTTVSLVQGVATAIPVGVTGFAKGLSIVGNSKITFSESGTYNIAFSSQIVKEDAGEDVISIWLCKGSNGGTCSNVPWTDTDLYLTGAGVRNVAAWNFFVESSPGDYYQLMISSSGTTLKTKILSTLSQSSPSRPEIPGTIVTVNQVG